MMLLVAADGTTLQSQVAHRFENAVWYVFVNSVTLARKVYQNLAPNDHHHILLRAARLHVHTVIAERVTGGTARLMLSLNQHLVVARKMTVGEAIGSHGRNELHVADLARHVRPAEEVRRTLLLEGKKGRKRMAGATGLRSGSSLRGQHHLQQYGGRGH